MKTLVKALLASLLLVWLAAPGVSGEGGENAGGTGVWILPRCAPLAMPSPAAGQTWAVRDFGRDFLMEVSPECGAVSATIMDPVTGYNVPLTVQGRIVAVDSTILDAYAAAQVSMGEILIADDQLQGYHIDLVVDFASRTAEAKLR